MSLHAPLYQPGVTWEASADTPAKVILCLSVLFYFDVRFDVFLFFVCFFFFLICLFFVFIYFILSRGSYILLDMIE